MLKNIFYIFVLSLFTFSGYAKGQWNRIVVPGAYCGDGKPYHIYFLERDIKKLLITFVSGGACWSKSTCYGPNFRTWIHPTYSDPKLPVFARKTNKFDNHSVLFLPYCTGDVFAGKHVAEYKGKKVYHYGAKNVTRTFEYLSARNFIHFNKVDDILLYGSSAGGIGAILHSRLVEKLVKRNAKKTIISDSPGLHFGQSFWNKFTDEQIQDFKDVFESVKFAPPLTDGFVAPYLGETCRYLKKWDIGILLGSKDIVMSKVFGNITMKNHENLVYSVNGIAETFRHYENCSAWIKRSKIHTFLLGGVGSWKSEVKGVSTLDFIYKVHASRNHSNVVEDKID